jgi:hypothetical protein
MFELEECSNFRSMIASKLRESKKELKVDALNCNAFIGQVWRHHGNQHDYLVVETSSSIKISGAWSKDPLITYQDVNTGIRYSRLLADFLASFERMK